MNKKNLILLKVQIIGLLTICKKSFKIKESKLLMRKIKDLNLKPKLQI